MLSKQLVGILLCIYVKEEHKDHISAVQADHAGVGIMGMMGNKVGFSSCVCGGGWLCGFAVVNACLTPPLSLHLHPPPPPFPTYFPTGRRGNPVQLL